MQNLIQIAVRNNRTGRIKSDKLFDMTRTTVNSDLLSVSKYCRLSSDISLEPVQKQDNVRSTDRG